MIALFVLGENLPARVCAARGGDIAASCAAGYLYDESGARRRGDEGVDWKTLIFLIAHILAGGSGHQDGIVQSDVAHTLRGVSAPIQLRWK